MEISPGLNNLYLNSLNSFFLKPTGHRRSRTYARVLIIIFHPNRVCMQHGGTQTPHTHTREGFTGNISKMWRRNWHWHVPECNSKVISYWNTDKSDLLNFYFHFFCTEFVIVRVKSTSEKHNVGCSGLLLLLIGVGLCKDCILLGQKGTLCSTPCTAQDIQHYSWSLWPNQSVSLQKAHSILLQFLTVLYFVCISTIHGTLYRNNYSEQD